MAGGDGTTGRPDDFIGATGSADGPRAWSSERLAAARLEMDPIADGVVGEIFARGERAAVNDLLVHVTQNDQLVPQALPDEVQRYLRETGALPGWADPQAIARAQGIFATHGPLCFAVLIGSSLPETYALPSIAEALGATQQLETHATRRILKTAQLLVDVLSPGGLAADGRGVRAAQRVRLLHASIRHLIAASSARAADQERTAGRVFEALGWPTAQRGAPICQQDMAYTILTFSVTVLDGLEKLDQELGAEDRDAFVHTWAVVGALMGVHDDLLPRDYDSARTLLDTIRREQAARTDAGVLLTSRTIDAFHALLRSRALPAFIATRETAVLIVRTLLSPGTAELTGVPELTLLQRLLAVPLMHLATIGVGLVDWIAHHDREALFIQKIVARHMVDHLAALPAADAKALFWIPAELRERWAAGDTRGESMSPTQPLTARIEWIVGLDDQPALRNLLITQCYHDLSAELARVLGPENVNWCTFATWASKTAGRFIRNEEIPGIFRGMLAESAEFRASAEHAVAGVEGIHPATTMKPDSLLEVAEEVAGDVSGQITAGNLAVFSELAPIFARFVALFDGGPPERAAADPLLDSLKVGPSDEGGQTLLRHALEHLFAAAAETDPRKRAALMLVSNAQTGLHEQIRLQPYIAGSLEAPIDDTVARLLERHTGDAPSHSILGRLEALWQSASDRLARDARKVWCDVATKELMTLAVPGQVLRLGEDLPPPPGQPLYPALLDPVDGQDAQRLLEEYDATDPDARGEVGASDWAQLSQRMRYIVALFRSRQRIADLLQQPFDDAQRAAILEGEVPGGPL